MPPPFDLLEAVDEQASDEVAAIDDLGALIDRLTKSNVRAVRNDSPDLLAQLHVALKRPIDTVICTAMDVDPAACIQSAWASEKPEDVVAGVSALANACRATRRMIVIDSRTPGRWFNALRTAARAAQPAVKIIEIENDYPQAD